MRRAVIYSCLIGWLVIFCLTINLFESVTMFLLFGVVPWSQAALSAQSMLVFYYTTALAIVVITLRKQLKDFVSNVRLNSRQTQA